MIIGRLIREECWFVILHTRYQGPQLIKGKNYKKNGNYSRGLGVENLQEKKERVETSILVLRPTVKI